MEFSRSEKNAPLFKGLKERDLELIAAQAHRRTFEKGELLFYEGDELTYWYYVIDGVLRAYKNSHDDHEVSICHIDANMAVNDIHLNENRYETTTFGTIEAQTNGVMIGFKTSALPLLFAQIPEFTLRCFHTVLTSVQNYQCAFYNGMVLDAMGKVAFMLAHDLEKFNRLKKQEIALLLNIQPETLSRLLGKLARKEIIQTDKDIIVLNYEALKDLYS